MLFRLFLFFTLIPMAELYILIHIGGIIGGFNTIILVIITGFIGAYLARMEGLNTMIKVRRSLDQGHMPAEELLDAFIILVAGLVLITPGLLTDTQAFCFYGPPHETNLNAFYAKNLTRWRPKAALTSPGFIEPEPDG